MGKFIKIEDYYKTKPNGMSSRSYFTKKLIEILPVSVIGIDNNYFVENVKYNLEHVPEKNGWFTSRPAYDTWEVRYLFKIYEKHGDIHVVSYSKEVSEELVEQLYNSIKMYLSESINVVFTQAETKIEKTNSAIYAFWDY